MRFLQYRTICPFSMSVLLVLNVNFLAVRVMDQSCGIGLVFSVILDREGVKQKKARGGGGGRPLIEGGDYLKYFNQKGAIIRGRRLIEGRLLFLGRSASRFLTHFILDRHSIQIFRPRGFHEGSKHKRKYTEAQVEEPI